MKFYFTEQEVQVIIQSIQLMDLEIKVDDSGFYSTSEINARSTVEKKIILAIKNEVLTQKIKDINNER